MKKTLRYLRPLASIASFALFVYVLERSGPTAVLESRVSRPMSDGRPRRESRGGTCASACAARPPDQALLLDVG